MRIAPFPLASLAAASLAAGLLPAAPARAAADVAVFDLYFGGFSAGEARISLEMTDGAYRAEAEGRATGLVGSLLGGTFRAASAGESLPPQTAPAGENGAPPPLARPESFTAEGSFAGDEIALSILFGPEAVEKVEADPPYRKRSWEVDPTAQRHVADPLAAIALLLREREDGKICDVAWDVFDGRRRVRASLAAPEIQQGGVRCEARIERIAGFRPKTMAKPDIEFSVWFDRPAGAPARLAKVFVPTDYGVATAVRRD